MPKVIPPKVLTQGFNNYYWTYHLENKQGHCFFGLKGNQITLCRLCYLYVVGQDKPSIKNAPNHLALPGGKSQHLVLYSFPPTKMSTAKAIPGCYLFTRNLTFLCIKFWRSQSDPKDPFNYQRLFFVCGALQGEQAMPNISRCRSSWRGKCRRSAGGQAASHPPCQLQFANRGWSLPKNPLSPEGAPPFTFWMSPPVWAPRAKRQKGLQLQRSASRSSI